MVSWARTIGPDTARLVEAIIKDRPHPEQGYRSCLGVIRLEKRYGQQRLEAACRRAVAVGARSYKSVALTLSKGLDSQPLPKKPGENDTPLLSIVHENIRGPDYYKEEKC
jgi:transposase